MRHLRSIFARELFHTFPLFVKLEYFIPPFILFWWFCVIHFFSYWIFPFIIQSTLKLCILNNLFANDSAVLAGLSWVILLNAFPGATHAAVVTERLDWSWTSRMTTHMSDLISGWQLYSTARNQVIQTTTDLKALGFFPNKMKLIEYLRCFNILTEI